MNTRALELLIAGHTVPEIAEELGVSRTTVWRWSRQPEFAHAFLELRRTRFESAQMMMDETAFDAIRVLQDVMNDEAQSGASRVAAAREVLDRAGWSPARKAPVRYEGTVKQEIDGFLDRLGEVLDEETYERVLRAATAAP